jgi:hypothetical protein
MEKEIILEQLREVTNNKSVTHTLCETLNNSILKELDEISSCIDVEKKLREKIIECTLKKLELQTIYEKLNQ